MNVAVIALPSDRAADVPPLSLAYIAAVLEQRRHIVRIYDLALTPDVSLPVAFRPLRAFRPQVVILAGDRTSTLEKALASLHDQGCHIMPLRLKRDSVAAGCTCAGVMARIDQQHAADDEYFVNEGSGAFYNRHYADLDRLPFPSRHLLSLERYALRAVGGELQTTLLVGAPAHEGSDSYVLRSPAQIVAELRGVSREFGIRHYLFPGVQLTVDMHWLHELLTRLSDAQLGIGWEASVDAELLDEELLQRMARAGCEKLRISLNAALVFDTAVARARFKQIVASARQSAIYAHADLILEPPYETIHHLVDVATTFGLDDVSFSVRGSQLPDATNGHVVEDRLLEEEARRRYRAGRKRQQMIEQFGPTLGGLIWRLRNLSLFSRGLDEGYGAKQLEDQEDLARSI